MSKAAFKVVGARMWHDDDAHKFSQDSINFMVEHSSIGRQIARPLTVLDSYPDVTDSQREWLENMVTEIHDKYQNLLDEALGNSG